MHEGSCYRLFQQGKNFDDAEKDCNNMKGHLAAWQSQVPFVPRWNLVTSTEGLGAGQL